MEELELRVAWSRFVTADNGSRAAFDDLLARYREPHRAYHNLSHITWVVRHLLAFDIESVDLAVAVAAAFYHDAIYDPRATDNEPASARLAEQQLDTLGWEAPRTASVARLIVATADHQHHDDLTTAALITADLGVLASAPNDYADYARQIRTEYGYLDESMWVTGRRAVLESFTDRAAIFDPRVAPPDWEPRARANIAAELAELGGTGS